MYIMMISKRYRLGLLLLAALGLGVMAFLYYQYRTSNHLRTPQEISHRRYRQHRLKIRGFEFDGIYEGKKVLSIKADKFTIEKRKLGFFRLGLMNVARFENGVIDIYGEREHSADDAAPKSPGQRTDRFQINSKLSQGMTFKDVFRKESLPSVPIRRISSIMSEPISLNMHDE